MKDVRMSSIKMDLILKRSVNLSMKGKNAHEKNLKKPVA